MDMLDIYRDCVLIRKFERRVEKEFELGKFRGTTHGCIGQEIIPVLVMRNIDHEKDYVTGTHRCHGQVLAYTHDPYRLACEMMGRTDGFNCGMGGSQHIKTGRYITNGVTGGMAAVGTGMALYMKKNGGGMVASFLGDGGFQEGYVGEAMNIAAAAGAPILYVLENNHYAMSTPTANYSSGTPKSRTEALGMRYFHADVRNIEELDRTISDSFAYVRNNSAPALIEVDTFRLCGHSKSDDRSYMTEEEKAGYIADDPVAALHALIPEEQTAATDAEAERTINDAFARASECGEINMTEYRRRLSEQIGARG